MTIPRSEEVIRCGDRLSVIWLTFILVMGLLSFNVAGQELKGDEQAARSTNVEKEQGASFDCSKASNAIENVICDSPRLSLLDRKLSDLYDQLVKLPGRRESLRKDQLNWLKEDRYSCREATVPPGYNYSKEVAIERCLHPVYSERIYELRRSGICESFRSIVKDYGFNALVNVENIRGNKHGVNIPSLEAVRDDEAKSLIMKSIEWGYMNADRYSQSEKLRLIEERQASLERAMDRWGTELFRSRVDYDDDGYVENAIILLPVRKSIKPTDFKGKYFIFDADFRVRDKYYNHAGWTGWIVEFMGDIYHYNTGYSKAQDEDQLYLSEVYTPPGSSTRVQLRQICELGF